MTFRSSLLFGQYLNVPLLGNIRSGIEIATGKDMITGEDLDHLKHDLQNCRIFCSLMEQLKFYFTSHAQLRYLVLLTQER